MTAAQEAQELDETPVANLLRIAFYAGDLLEELDDAEAATSPGANYYELLAGLLARAGTRIRRAGLNRGYFTQTELGARPRGRLLLAESIATSSLATNRLHYAADDFAEDTPDNRAWKAAIRFLTAPAITGNTAHPSATSEQLHDHLRMLRAVTDVRLDEYLLRTLTNRHVAKAYRVSRFVVRLLARNHEPDGESIGEWARSLAQDAVRMRRVFERFILRFAKANAPNGLRVCRPSYRWASHPRASDPRVPTLNPDAVLRWPSQSRVVECKYTPRLLERGMHGTQERLRAQHLQQLFSYLSAEWRTTRRACNREKREALQPSGILLYPRVGKAISAHIALERFPVHIVTIDLGQPWDQLRVALCRTLFAPPNQ